VSSLRDDSAEQDSERYRRPRAGSRSAEHPSPEPRRHDRGDRGGARQVGDHARRMEAEAVDDDAAEEGGEDAGRAEPGSFGGSLRVADSCARARQECR
jgi:hypothetical protein